MMRFLLCLLLLSIGVAGLAQPDVQAQETLRQKLEGYLAHLDPNMPLAGNPAEEGFVAQGMEAVPVMQAMSRDISVKLAAAEENGRQDDILRLRFQLEFLDRAIVRLETDLNPPAMIRQWVRQQYRPEDQYIADILPEPVHLTDAPLARAFPGYLFYAANFRHYPVARDVPPPLTVNNLFAVRLPVQPDNGKTLPLRITVLTNSTDMKLFFLNTVKPLGAKDKVDETVMGAMQNLTSAWLCLSQSLQDDGFFRFTIPAESLQFAASDGDAGGYIYRGRAAVTPAGGNSGSIDVELYFNPALLLIDVKEVVKLKPGIRPICQATKLLDPDPIVRKMAEQDLLIMGPAAHDYMMEQRAKATPELQAAIDRMWERILERERQVNEN